VSVNELSPRVTVVQRTYSTVARVVPVVHAWLHSHIYDTLYHSRRSDRDRDYTSATVEWDLLANNDVYRQYTARHES